MVSEPVGSEAAFRLLEMSQSKSVLHLQVAPRASGKSVRFPVLATTLGSHPFLPKQGNRDPEFAHLPMATRNLNQAMYTSSPPSRVHTTVSRDPVTLT
jgi:hypothetical protein